MCGWWNETEGILEVCRTCRNAKRKVSCTFPLSGKPYRPLLALNFLHLWHRQVWAQLLPRGVPAEPLLTTPLTLNICPTLLEVGQVIPVLVPCSYQVVDAWPSARTCPRHLLSPLLCLTWHSLSEPHPILLSFTGPHTHTCPVGYLRYLSSHAVLCLWANSWILLNISALLQGS